MDKDIQVESRKTAFRKRIQTFALVNLIYKDVYVFFNHCFEHFDHIIHTILNEHFYVKINTNFIVDFVRMDGDKITDKIRFYVQSASRTISNETNMRKWYKKHVTSFHVNKIEEFVNSGSNWTLYEIVECVINSHKCEYIASGSSYIDLPDILKNKKSIVNVKNADQQCFKWAVLSALFPVQKNAGRLRKYLKHKNKLNFSGIKFPVKLSDIHRFEQNNKNISVNVYSYENKSNKSVSISPIRLTKNVKKHHVNLLLIQRCSSEFEKHSILYEKLNSAKIDSHYCWIKNMSRLLCKQLSKKHTKKYVCNICLQFFTDQINLNLHIKDCKNVNKERIDMPDVTNKWIYFRNYHHQLRCPFIIYADIESYLKPIEQKQNHSEQSYQQHIPYSIGYYFKYLFDDSKSFYSSYTGEDCDVWFVEELDKLSILIDDLRSVSLAIIMTEDDELQYNESKFCFICNKRFFPDEIKVRDHSHFTGQFRGAAHSSCNLKYKESSDVSVVFHNLNYDSHFIIEKIATYLDGPVSVIPVNSEKYISFTKKISFQKFDNTLNKYQNKFIKFRFIDSFRFMPNSLADLASYLPADKFYELNSQFPNISQTKISLLRRKGVFPYDYIDTLNKLRINKLPDKKYFFSKLTETHITDEDYSHAQRIWNIFKIQNLQEYSELYLKTDVLLLADIFENFRTSCIQIYKLDPAHYYTAPALSWDSMLKFTRVRIELITDIDMLLFIERGTMTVLKFAIPYPDFSFFRCTRRIMSMFVPIYESQ